MTFEDAGNHHALVHELELARPIIGVWESLAADVQARMMDAVERGDIREGMSSRLFQPRALRDPLVRFIESSKRGVTGFGGRA